MNKYLLFCLTVMTFAACKPKKHTVSLSTLADTATYFHEQIIALEKTLDFADLDAFSATNDKIQTIKNQATSAIQSYFAEHNGDTLYFQFDQSKNIEKFKIQRLWITNATYNELLIEAQVYAMDNSAFRGAHTALAVKQRNGSRLESGGGIAAHDTVKLIAGKTYTFSGTIKNLHKLGAMRTVLFDEAVKRW